jgi:hypothetical protein
MNPVLDIATQNKNLQSFHKDINPWDKVRGMWKNKKIDSLKHQQKIRQEWK